MAARKTLSTFSICLGVAALVAAVAIVPADAKKRKKTPQIESTLSEAEAQQPMTLVISLGNQKVDIYRGTTLITSSRVSTGKRGYATKAGVFSILEKRRRHYSNMYGGAPMPWMQRLTWSGTALHAGVVPGYPASHGCVRLPRSFAPKLFAMTEVGGQVVVAHGSVKPKLIEHDALFQPLPLPAPPSLVKQEEKPQTMQRSNIETKPPFGSSLPVVLTKAAHRAIVTDISQGFASAAPEAHGFAPMTAPTPLRAKAQRHAEMRAPVAVQRSISLANLEDTRIHAIDPYAAPFMGSGAHAVAVKPAVGGDYAAVGTSDDFMKHQDRLAAKTVEPAKPSVAAASASALPQAAASKPASDAVALKTPVLEEAAEPQAGLVLSVSATALAQPAPVAPASGMLKAMAPAAKPSIVATKLGAAAAAIMAAEPLSTAPLRILVTRSTQRDRMIGVQYILASLGHLEVQNFDGTFGRKTARAIKAFQAANDMPETGAFTDDLVKKVYAIAGKDEPPSAHLFVRQKFSSVFDTPVRIRNPDAKLGTHVFTVMNFAPGDTKAQWMAISLKGDDDPSMVLDRLVIPDDIRQNISERLTPGSSLIIADIAINSATLPKGADFLVWDTSKPAKVHRASVAKPRARKRRRAAPTRRRAPTYTQRSRYSSGWPF